MSAYTAEPDPRLCLVVADRRFFAALHQPPIESPQAAVRAAIVAEKRRMPM